MKFGITIHCLVVLHFVLAAPHSHATTPPPVELKFGPEFTFTTLDFNNGPKEKLSPVHPLAERCRDTPNQARREWCYNFFHITYNHLVLGQPEGAQFSYNDLVFESPNNWSFEVSTDKKVVEIKMPPLSLEKFKQFANDIQDAIFVSASNIGLIPWDFQGGGHINIGFEELASNPLLLRNFIVDLYNHPELTMGVWGYDTNNALPWHMTPQPAQKSFKTVIEAFDRGEYRTLGGTMDFVKAVRDATGGILEDIYALNWSGSSLSRIKNTAISLFHVDDANKYKRRIEIRSFRPQKNIYQWIHQIELLQARVNYLHQLNKPIPLQRADYLVPHTASDHLLEPPIDAQLALRHFYLYVKECGQKWDQHRDYLWPTWIQKGELKRFEDSDFFISQEGLVGADMENCPESLQANEISNNGPI